MQKSIWLLACGYALLIISYAQADDIPELPADEIAARVLTVTDIVLNHHIDPPTRQQMLLVGVKSLLKAAGIDPPVGLSRRISALATDEELTGFIKDIWSTTTADSKVPFEQLSESLTDGLLQSIPGRSRLISRKEADVSDQFANNRYVGIGIALSTSEGRPMITQVIPGGPSDRGGVKDSDMILSIDGVSTKNENLRQVVGRLRGEEGSRVKLELRSRGSDTSRTIVLTRGVVLFKHVTDSREMPLRNGTSAGYLRITQISSSVLHELRKYEVQWQSSPVRAVVLDLRNAHGGRGENIHNAVTLADGLLDGGDIGRVQTARGIKRYKAGPDCLFREWPLVLLIGPNTSGTAEWLAAALRDNGRAVLVGAPTHGRGALNTAVPLPGTDLVLTMNTGIMQRADGTPIASKQRDAGPLVLAPSTQITTVNANGRRSIVTIDANGRRLIAGKPLAPQDGGVTPDHFVSALRTRIALRRRGLTVAENVTRDNAGDAALTKAIEVVNGLVPIASEAKPADQDTSDDAIKASPPKGE